MPSTPIERDTTQVPLIITSNENDDTPRAEAHDETQIQTTEHENTQSLPAVNDDLPPPWQSIFKKEFEQSWPLMLRGAVVAGRYFAISVMLGKVDERLLAPNTLINSLESIYIIFGGRSLSIIGSMISKLKGEENAEKIGLICRQGLIFGTLISLPVTALYYFANHHMLAAFGQHPFAVEKAKDYFHAAALGYLPLILMTAQQRLLQGLHRPIPVLASNVLHSTLSVICSYLFLFGKLDAPKLEMAGVGYAFAIAGWASLILNTIYISCSKSLENYHLTRMQFDLTSDDFKKIITKGLPTGLQFTTENIANMINSIFLGLHNLTALSADQMASQIALLTSIANGGLAQAISVCVGESLGKKQYQAIKRYGNAGLLAGTIFPIVSLLLFLFLREQFVGLFIDTSNPNNAELTRLASTFLLFESLRQFTTGIQFTTTGALLGLQDTAFTMKTSVAFSLFLNAAILCLMHFALHLNSMSLFAAKTIGVGIAAFFNTGHWLLQSHEQSEQDKAEVKEIALCARLSRSVGLFCQTPERHDISDLARAETANAPATI